jgi:putative FmdB family regulatory protein
MPIYEYACGACGQTFERLEKMGEPSVTACPACGKRKARRLISRVAGIVKGATPTCGDRSAPCRGSDSVCASGSCPMKNA